MAVLDERVAQATIKFDRLLKSNEDDLNAGGELKFQKAGIFPLFSFKRDGETWACAQLRADGETGSWVDHGSAPSLAYGFLSKTIVRAAYKISWDTENSCWRDSYVKVWINEGLLLDADVCKAHYAYLVDKSQPATEEVKPDVVVIHEGVADTLHNSGRWNADDVARLYECAPAVVRTSGRGHISRYLARWLPFVEFNEISANIYKSLNKLALTKSLLGTAGEEVIRT